MDANNNELRKLPVTPGLVNFPKQKKPFYHDTKGRQFFHGHLLQAIEIILTEHI